MNSNIKVEALEELLQEETVRMERIIEDLKEKNEVLEDELELLRLEKESPEKDIFFFTYQFDGKSFTSASMTKVQLKEEEVELIKDRLVKSMKKLGVELNKEDIHHFEYPHGLSFLNGVGE